MKVSDQLKQLGELGLTDQRIKELRNKFKQLSLKSNEALQEAEKLAQKDKTVEEKNKELLLLRKKYDGDLQLEKANLRKWEARAEKIKGEREYTALISEIGSLKKTISNIETQILEIMEEQGISNKNYEKVKADLTNAKAKQEQEWDLVKEEIASIEKQVEDNLAERKVLLEKIPPTTAKRYEQIAAKRAGVGIGWVKKEVCLACSRKMPPELFLRVAKAEVLEQCPSCQRILVAEGTLFATTD